ncbi:MAG: hypothetical protein AAGD07_06505 [Planctomycetota bacterium]
MTLSESSESLTETLETPGRIAIVGCTPTGIEAALYGRFLGYDVQVFARGRTRETHPLGSATQYPGIGPDLSTGWWHQNGCSHDHDPESLLDAELPCRPSDCLTPLALSALESQFPECANAPRPRTLRQWIEGALGPLCQTDLLRGRVHPTQRVCQVDLVPVETDDEEPGDVPGTIPPDFLITREDSDGESHADPFECLIAVETTVESLGCSFGWPAPYAFKIDAPASGPMEDWFRSLRTQTTQVFAALTGRPALDLYRPGRL